MPAFIKTPADEKRWSRAKEAANKTLSESAGDSYWKLVNSIYHKMTKSEDLEVLENILLKARRRLSDEPSEDEEELPLDQQEGFRSFDPETEGDEADRWLQEHDPQVTEEEEEENEEPKELGEEPGEEDDYYEEYSPDEDEDSHMQDVEPAKAPQVKIDEQPTARVESEGDPVEEVPPQAQEEVKSEGRFPQPSKEEIAEMRQYTRPWEQRARDKTRLEAEASKNPVLHHEGRLLEARNTAHKNRQDAYAQFQASPEYQGADPITQMEMDADFNKKWHESNPEYLQNAVKLHEEAHKKGQAAKDIHAAAKDEQIRHILAGGAQPEVPMSTEEALQHAGGVKGEEGTVGSMTQDRASSFAAGNKEFLNQYAKDYAKKGKKPNDLNEMMNYDEGSRADVQRVLGEHPALKDPSKKAKVDAFFEKYHPLIGMNAHKVLNKLGLDHRKGDVDLGMLHEAGMHGLMQAINDYEHDHPSQASFATHAGNKMRGLMQTALRAQDQIPQELRVGAKKFSQQGPQPQAAPAVPQAPKISSESLIGKHPPEVADRMKRIQTFRRAAQAQKPPKPEGGGQQ